MSNHNFWILCFIFLVLLVLYWDSIAWLSKRHIGKTALATLFTDNFGVVVKFVDCNSVTIFSISYFFFLLQNIKYILSSFILGMAYKLPYFWMIIYLIFVTVIDLQRTTVNSLFAWLINFLHFAQM